MIMFSAVVGSTTPSAVGVGLLKDIEKEMFPIWVDGGAATFTVKVWVVAAVRLLPL